MADRGAYEFEEPGPILCWNYRANHKGTNRLWTANGSIPSLRILN